jgi:hypothetical protein
MKELGEIARALDAHNERLQSREGRDKQKRALADFRERTRWPWGESFGLLGLAEEPPALWPHEVT